MGLVRRGWVAAVVLLALAVALACSDDDGGSDPPEDLPVFEGAQFESGVSDENDGVETFRGVWRTSEDPAAVQEFFERELQREGWRIVDTITTEDAVVIRVEREVDGEPESGTVIIDASEGDTQIVPTIRRGKPKPRDDDDEVSLPSGYPAQSVPLPPGITLESVNGPDDAGGPIFQVTFTSTDPLPTLSSYWRTTLPAQGWGLVFEGESATEFTLQFEGEDGSVTLTGRPEDAGSLGNVTVILP